MHDHDTPADGGIPITITIHVDAAAAVRGGKSTAGPHRLRLTPGQLAELTPAQRDALAHHVAADDPTWAAPLHRWAPPVAAADLATLASLLDQRCAVVALDDVAARRLCDDLARGSAAIDGREIVIKPDAERQGWPASPVIPAHAYRVIVGDTIAVAARLPGGTTIPADRLAAALRRLGRDAFAAPGGGGTQVVLPELADLIALASAERQRRDDAERAAEIERRDAAQQLYQATRDAERSIVREIVAAHAVAAFAAERFDLDTMPRAEYETAIDAWAVAMVHAATGLPADEIERRRVCDYRRRGAAEHTSSDHATWCAWIAALEDPPLPIDLADVEIEPAHAIADHGGACMELEIKRGPIVTRVCLALDADNGDAAGGDA